MPKVDFKKHFQHLYQPSAREVVQVEVPTLNYLMLDGEGDPNTSPSYQAAVEALFALSYTIKFIVKKGALAIDYGVLPLEGLWWMEDMSAFSLQTKADWEWTMMILQPVAVTQDQFEQARELALRKKGTPVLEYAHLECYAEGMSAQTTYLGAYDEEGPTIAALHDFIHAQGCERVGKHHEIYLGDPRRTAPERLKTVIRQPMWRSDEG